MLGHVDQLVVQGRLVQKGQMPDRQHEIETDVGRQWRDPQPLDGQPALRKPEQEQRRDDHGQDDVLQHVQAEEVVVTPHVDGRLQRQEQAEQAGREEDSRHG